MAGLEELKQAAEVKRRESMRMSQAYSGTLARLAPANFLLVVGAALLSLLAGAAILTEARFLTPVASGVLALVSGALTIIHSKLGCEEYQAECRKLVSFYRGMAEDYSNLQFIDNADDFRQQFFGLNNQLSVATKNTSAWPFKRAAEIAKKCAD